MMMQGIVKLVENDWERIKRIKLIDNYNKVSIFVKLKYIWENGLI